LPPGTPPPRLITDNDGAYMSLEFKAYLRERDISHSRTWVCHPHSNGKMERFHRSLKSECVRTTARGDLAEARRLIAAYVTQYNTERLHSALHYLTPDDYLRGPEHVQQRHAARARAVQAAAERRRVYWRAHAAEPLVASDATVACG